MTSGSTLASPQVPGPAWLPAIVRQHPVLIGLLIVVLSRIAVFAYAYAFPITNEVGMPVSPTRIQPWIDFQFYVDSLEFYRSNGPLDILRHYAGFYTGGRHWNLDQLISGPVFPALIALFDYREGHTVPLAVFYLLMSMALAAFWLRWLADQGMHAFGILLFALLPNPLWFMLNVTSDLPLAMLVALFIFYYRRPVWRRRDVALWVMLMLACAMTRPNGAAVLLFVFLDLLFRVRLAPRQRLAVLLFIGGAGLTVGIYLLPYFLHEVRKVLEFELFFMSGYEYLEGIYPALPVWLDKPLSWLSLAGAKLLYFVGLRPSFAGISLDLLLLRSAAGLILLPGLLYLAFRGDRRDRLFVWIFFLPIFIGPTQDRYNLPIQGLLFFYGLQAYALLWQTMQRWRAPGA